MTTNLSAKLCNYTCIEKSLSAESQAERSQVTSVDSDSRIIATKLVPWDYAIEGLISAKIVKTADIINEQYCYESASGHLDWHRGRFDSFPIITNTLIKSCRMSGYQIAAFGTDDTVDGREILSSSFAKNPGDINDEDGVLQYDPNYEYEHQQLQNQIVPGEDVKLFAMLFPEFSPAELVKQWIGHVWWSTTYLSGGEIVSVNGDYGDVDLTYTVSIMGQNRTAVSSDFIEYAVGDWIYVTYLGAISQGCEWQDNEDVETGISESIEDATWIIVPLKISDYGA